MADPTVLVSEIELKVLTLIRHVRLLKAENDKFQQEINQLKSENEEQKKTIRESESKIKILRTVKTLETKEGTVEAKARVNDLLREIDKCIGLLNT
jgi:hypothetical protein